MGYLQKGLKNKGVTLIELMIGLLIITIAFASLSTIFSAISTSILVNKTKTIATNLAQEKIESLKNLAYYRLLVTTTTTTDPNFPGMIYDQGTTQSYYPEEILYVGGLTFHRRVLVDFVKEDNGSLVAQPWTADDTGIKRVTVYVVWQEGEDWKKVELSNLRNNPNRAQLDFSFTGTVSSGTGDPIYNALVETVENPSYFGRTDASGVYSFKVQPGTYTLRASATGYFTALSTSIPVQSDQTGSLTQNFTLSLMATGNATGYAYIRDHLVITQVVSSTNSGTDNGSWEWVELYNPTTYDMLIASRASPTSAWNVFFVTVTYICSNNDEPPDNPGNGHPARHLIGSDPYSAFAFRSVSPYWTENTTTISIPSNHFFLIANVSTITAVDGVALNRIADAYYFDSAGYNPSSPLNVIKAGSSGGIRVTGTRGYSFNGRSDWHDGLAWGNNASITKPMETSPNANSLDNGEILHRLAYKLTSGDCYNANTHLGRTAPPFVANAFDDNNNGSFCGNGSDFDSDVISYYITNSSALANCDIQMAPLTGTPAKGASASANDGLSQIAYATNYGMFTLTNIATGTWTVTVSSGDYTRDISSVTVLPNISTSIPNMSTDPQMPFPTINAFNVALTSTSIYGYVSGTVVSASNQPLNGVTISAAGAPYDVVTNSQGKYRIPIYPASSVSVVASKTGYSTEITQNIGVPLGVDISTVNFTLVTAGNLTGFVTTNGTPSGALPGVAVVATDLSSTTIVGSAVTGVDGRFMILSVATGTYIVSPQLETGETASPGNVTKLVTTISTGTWTSTFTITNAFGEVTGHVYKGSDLITTGVLIVASTSSIASDTPPQIDSSVRDGSQIYYAVSSDAAGQYTLPIRGDASYYIYAWYPSSLDVSLSSAPKRQVTSPSTLNYVTPGSTIARDLQW